MAIRQYIGARYVPKFSDVNNGEWDNSYSYEPLTIVKYGNDFYTSKIPVPVGAAISDPTYWVLTGNYNGAISSLNDRVTVLENNMQYVVAERSMISAVDAKVGDIIISENSYSGDGHISYWLVATGTGDGYLSITLSNGLCASLIHDSNIYVHDVGAFPDGNNCENAINAALGIPGVNLIFDAGEYTFDGRIWLSDYQKITGQGEDTILYCSQDPAGNHGEFIGVIRDSGNAIKGTRISNIAIRLYTTTATEDVNPIGVNNANDLIIENVHILNSNWRGIQIEAGGNACENIIIRNCIIENTRLNGVGISHASGGHVYNVTLDNVRIYPTRESYGGIYVSGASDSDRNTKNISLNNIYIETDVNVPRGLYCTFVNGIKLTDIEIRTTATATAYLIQLQECDGVSGSLIRVECATTGDVMGVGVLNSKNVILSDIYSLLTDIGVRVQQLSGGTLPLAVLVSNSIQNGGRYMAVVSNAGITGYITGCMQVGTGSVLQSASTDFKEITA